MAEKGTGKGPPLPSKEEIRRPSSSSSAGAGGLTPPSGGECLADALARHSFRNTGVETKVTSRSEVEAALADIKPSRVRAAQELWNSNYPERPPVVQKKRSSRFADEDLENGGALSQVIQFSCEAMLENNLDPNALGSGVSPSYRQALIERLSTSGTLWPPLPPDHDPDQVWAAIAGSQKFDKPYSVYCDDDIGLHEEDGVLPLPPRNPNMVRFVCISDTHSRHNKVKLPEGDVLIHAGDFSMTGELKEVVEFGKWLASLPYAAKVVIAGNHDITFEPKYYKARGGKRFHKGNEYKNPQEVKQAFVDAAGPSVQYLEDESFCFRGISMFGSPWQPDFCDWAFNVKRGPAIAAKWEAIPSGIDVLVTHGPPLGRGDLCSHGSRAGCANLLASIQQRVKPAYVVYGHIHEGNGATFDGTTHYINASSCNVDYKCCNAPLVFEMPSRDDQSPALPAGSAD